MAILKKKFTKISLISLVGFSFLAAVAGSLAWFMGGGFETKKQADGEIGLRSYFYTGDGLTESTAFEITSPIHMFNLSQLQNIGLFPEKRYFRIGHYDETDGEYKVIVDYDSSGYPIWGNTLDMTGTTIAPIGNEATPFIGEFDGNGIPVLNATVKGNPEDIGFFGYVGYQGDINGLVLSNPTIESLGYNSDSTNKQYQLFNPEIEDLYYQSSLYFEKFTKVKFFGYDIDSQSRDIGTLLTNENGLGGSTYSNINYDGNGNLIHVDKGTEAIPAVNYIYNGYFDIKFPQDFLDDPGVAMTAEERNKIENDPFTYSWVASTPLIQEETCIDITGDSENDTLPMINLTKLINAGDEEGEFNREDVNSTVKTRLYLYASVEYKNFEYSRVIQSYDVEFHSNKLSSSEGYSMAMFCDYVAPASQEHTVTNYHHGNNIGFLAGHLDGNMQYCYVYGHNDEMSNRGAHLIMNNTDNMSPIATTSDIGLVGEVGEGVYNRLDPDMGVMVNGDTGVMNFTKIYEGIRKDFKAGDTAKAGHVGSPTANYISISGTDQSGKSIINTSDTSLFENYKEYLRYDTVNGQKHYLSGLNYTVPNGTAVDPGDDAGLWHNYTLTQNTINDHPELNSVDFLWNRVIQDEDGIDRGLGVFKLATVYNSSASNPNSDDVYKSMGKTAIVNGTDKDKVYFSTAEYDHKKNNNSGQAWKDEFPVRGSTIPSYSDVGSFDYNFERDYNYCFELDLKQIKDTGGYNMMSNTDSPWLANYLSSKLINKKGEAVEPGSKRFGFMFRSSDATELEALSSYMAVGYPKKSNKSSYGGKYYPSNSIVFKIDNENGANVSVVAKRNDVTIYSHHSTVQSSSDITPLYTMRVKSASSDISPDIDAHRYFKFDVKKTVIEDGKQVIKTGVTGTEAVPFDNDMKDSNNLYAHIFKLPQGEYVIGAAADGSNNDSTADIYYLAVQGQNDGDLGSDIVSEIGNVLDDVDFLTQVPSKSAFPNDLAKADFQFYAQFNSLQGDFMVNTVSLSATNYISLEFEGPDDQIFVNKLALTCNSLSPHYYVRGEEITKGYHPYR